jgi:hypothetical protein
MFENNEINYCCMDKKSLLQNRANDMLSILVKYLFHNPNIACLKMK